MAKKRYKARIDRTLNDKKYKAGKIYNFDEGYYKRCGHIWLDPMKEKPKEKAKEEKKYPDKEMK